jgi:hypothetical protein
MADAKKILAAVLDVIHSVDGVYWLQATLANSTDPDALTVEANVD